MNWKRFFIAGFIGGFGAIAQASDYGCKVLLCLANPNGPRAVSQCVPPIDQLFRDLAKGRAFPSCDMAEGPGGKSYAQQAHSYYDPCPEGTTALASGGYAMVGKPPERTRLLGGSNNVQTLYTGIGTGDGLEPRTIYGGEGTYEMIPLPGKVCVGKLQENKFMPIGSGEDYVSLPVGFYDRVVFMDPQASPRVIDVYIDNNLYRRVRW